jgi:AcrR family transcriptional regulator
MAAKFLRILGVIAPIAGGESTVAAGRDKLSFDLEELAKEHELYANPLTEKQRHILEAAEKLFGESGYAETSTASIAREAGVTEKTLFKHFPTKQDLLRRVLFPILLHTVVPLQVKLVRKVLQTSHESFLDLFRSLALDRWATARHLGPRLKFMLGEILQNDRLRAQLRKVVLESVWPEAVRNVERFQKAGSVRADVSAEDVARHQIVTIVGHALLRAVLSPDKPYDDEADAQLVADLVLNGVGARHPQKP